MASSRHMRRSRRSSPMDTFTQDNQPIKTEVQADDQNENLSEEWSEPPLRAPAPSFEDYKGLERHGVLEHMAPLGTLPGNKVKARLKQHEPPRRGAPLKNGDARVVKEEVNTPEPAPPVTTRCSEPRRAEDRPSKVSILRERDLDHEYTPEGNARSAPVKALSTHAARHGNAASRTAEGQSKLEKIVNSAVLRATELGDQVLGIAVKQLYEESLHNRELADLLDAVLTQKPSSSQTNQFQSYIKAARKKIRAGEDITSKSRSKSPAAKSARTSVTRNFASPKDRSSAPGLNHLPPDSNQRSSRQYTNTMETNGSPSKDERPSKRIKRSMSVSSDSSLSSLDSAVEDFAPTLDSALTSTPNHPPVRNIIQSKPQPSMGPRLGSFSTRPSDPSTRRPIISSPNPTFVPAPKPAVDITEQRKQLLKKNFSDFISRDSAIRTSPSPANFIQPAPITVSAERGQQARLRNGTGLRNRKDEYEALDSPTSSSYGDLLVPPPPGPARGATPNQLGRPRKEVKKAARIKMSPMKKQRGVTAGIARGAETESNAVGFGRNDDNQDQGNSDACSACSGTGQLLCCDGCWRAFHFTCLDPPMSQDKPPQGEWFCHKCQEARTTRPRPDRGVFAELAVDLDTKNVIAFNLPNQIRDYFEGVKTGEEGEYEEVGNAKANNKSRSGYEELPNNFRLKDNKNDTVLCYRCGKSTGEKREIIPCDFCNLSWHLDCLEPPIATAPKRNSNGKSKHTWMCPNHVDGLLSYLKTNAQVSTSKQVQPGTSRTYKVRRPKNASIVDIGLRRGFKNNGLIEIENEPSDDESENEKTYPPGVIYRVPEKGLKLDFIDRVKRVNAEERQAREMSSRVQLPSAKRRRLAGGRPTTATSAINATDAASAVSPTSATPAIHGDKVHQDNFQRRSFSDRKAALNLAQMSQSDAPVSANKVDNLIATLTAEAPAEVEKLYSSEEATPGFTTDAAPEAALGPVSEEGKKDLDLGPVDEEERKDLEFLMALIRRRLEGGKAAKT